jgi:hypothetical protein
MLIDRTEFAGSTTPRPAAVAGGAWSDFFHGSRRIPRDGTTFNVSALNPSVRPVFAVVIVAMLALSGCHKRPAIDTARQTELPITRPTKAQRVSPPANPATATSATNDTPTSAAGFVAASLASPFVQADLSLMESYNRALIAFQIGDYSRAAAELRDLAGDPDLNPQQKQAVADLLAKTLKLAPELARTNAGSVANVDSRKAKPAEFPVADGPLGESPKNLAENPFASADPAVKRSYSRARAAFDIGDYAIAVGELNTLSTNLQLNYQQKFAVQDLLSKASHKGLVAPARAPQR